MSEGRAELEEVLGDPTRVPDDYKVYTPEGEWVLLNRNIPSNIGLMQNTATNVVKHYDDLGYPRAGTPEGVLGE